MPPMPKEMLERILSHTDNHEPITADWLLSIDIPRGDGDGILIEEHEICIQCVDTRNNKQLDSSYGDEWEESTSLGYNVGTQEAYIETWGSGKEKFSIESQEIITLPPISTRLEFRLLLLAHRAWGYRGE